MARYSLTSKKQEGSITLGYNEAGLLTEYIYKIENSSPEVQLWFLKNMPHTYTHMMEMISMPNSSLRIIEIPEDLSFDRFYNEYNYKVGNKKRAQKLWNDLDDKDKVLAIVAIPRYNSFLKMRPNQDRLYPETYLSQQRYNSEFK